MSNVTDINVTDSAPTILQPSICLKNLLLNLKVHYEASFINNLLKISLNLFIFLSNLFIETKLAVHGKTEMFLLGRSQINTLLLLKRISGGKVFSHLLEKYTSASCNLI